jgi:hypothetical protein
MPWLILKRAFASPLSGEWKDDRIYEQGSGPLGSPELRWFWSITAIVPAVPHVTNGHAATRDKAKRRLRAGWRKA